MQFHKYETLKITDAKFGGEGMFLVFLFIQLLLRKEAGFYQNGKMVFTLNSFSVCKSYCSFVL